MADPNMNEAVKKELEKLVTVSPQGHVVSAPMPAPCSHGEFNRRMFLEAFLSKAGTGVGIEPEDIIEYSGITTKEFPIILREYIAKGVIVKADNLFGVEMYRLNMN